MADTLKNVSAAFGNWKQNDPKLECKVVDDNGMVHELVAHHAADGSIKHYCTALYCPDIHGVTS